MLSGIGILPFFMLAIGPRFMLLLLFLWKSGSTVAWGKLGLYLSVALTSSVKFLVGVFAALAIPTFGFWDTMLSVGLGALIGAWIFTFSGTEIRKWVLKIIPPPKQRSFASRRKIYSLWHRFGLLGAVALSPLISPMVSVGIALAFRERPWRIILFISVAIIFYTALFAALKNELNNFFALGDLISHFPTSWS